MLRLVFRHAGNSQLPNAYLAALSNVGASASASSVSAQQSSTVCDEQLLGRWVPNMARPVQSMGSRTFGSFPGNDSSSADRISTTQHFHVKAFYLGADVDIQAAAEKMSSRCLSFSKDFAVFTLGPTSAVRVGPEKLQALNAMYTSTQAVHCRKQAQGSGGMPHHQIQLITARQARPQSKDPPMRLTVSMLGGLLRTNLITEDHLLEHVTKHGVMIAFKFGSMVFFEPKPQTKKALQQAAEAAAATAGSDAGSGAAANVAAADGAAPAEAAPAGHYQREPPPSSAQLQQELKRAVRTAVTDPVPTSPRMEEAHVVLKPHMKRPFAKETDRVAIPELDLGSLEVICRVIGQSAALDFYTSKVDDSLRDFDKVLADLAANAGKPFFQRPLLFKRLRGGKLLATIASSSMMYNKVVNKLGLLDTSRTAWESDGHDVVWKGLKKEYELEQRFENLIKKLDIYKEESRFILEVRNERGSAAAERVIIVLIALEIIVNAAFHIYH